MKRFAVDASVVLAIVLHEQLSRWIEPVLDEVRSAQATLVAPSLLWIEVGNRLVRPDMRDEHALEAMLRIEDLGIGTIEVDRPLRLHALQLAREYGLSMYDATYLAAADATGAPLLTLDLALEQAATSLGLGSGGGRSGVSETRAGYGDGPDVGNADRTSLAAIGAALAEMRLQLSE